MSDLLAVDEYLEDPSWLTGGGADSGLNYCRKCAIELRAQYGDECIVDGGWPQVDDSPPQCEKCIKPLAASLPDGTEIDTEQQWLEWCRLNLQITLASA